MRNLYPYLKSAIFFAVALTGMANLRAQTCAPPPAAIVYPGPDGQTATEAATLQAGFTPEAGDQSRFDGDEYAYVVSESGIQASAPVCVMQDASGTYFFDQITIFRANDCYAPLIPGFPQAQIDFDPNCLMGAAKNALKVSDQTGTYTYEGYFFVVYDPPTAAGDDEYFVVTGPNGAAFDGSNVGGFFGNESGDTPPAATPGSAPPSEPDVPATGTTSAPSTNSNSTALPVELTALTGRFTGKHVELDWSTATESANDYFAVERLADNGAHFETLGTLAGAGESRTMRNYQFVDLAPRAGLNYYRLRQVDFGGDTHYSSIVTVQVTATEGSEVVLAPNPTSGRVDLRFGTGWGADTTGELIDARGRVLWERPLGAVVTAQLDVSGYPPGVYYLRLSDGANHVVRRVVRR